MTLLLYGSQPRGLLPALGLARAAARAAQLPILTTAGDVREVVRYLKRRPGGVSVAEESDRPRRRLFEPRKLAAYELLGLVAADGDSVRLSPLGLACAEEMEPEARVFRRLLVSTAAYRSALEWGYRQGLGVITTSDLLGFWRESHPEALDESDGELARGAALSFFSLCQAAGLGTMTLGKRGHSTRLSVDQDELRALFDGAPATFNEADEEEASIAAAATHIAGPRPRQSLRILVLAGSDNGTVGLLRRTLELAAVESRLVEKDWGGRVSFEQCAPGLAPDCDAVFVVLDETTFVADAAGRHSLRETVLIEIGAALVRYDRRVVLLLDEKFPSPEAVRELDCYEVVNGGLTWEAGLRLLAAVERFKHEVGPGARA